MPMNAGDATVQPNTMARAIYDALLAMDSEATDRDQILRELAAAAAQGVVAHITGFAQANTDTGAIT